MACLPQKNIANMTTGLLQSVGNYPGYSEVSFGYGKSKILC